MELKYILQTFGIPASTMPITSEGEILVDDHCEKWAKRRNEERTRVAAKDQVVDKEINLVRVGTPGNNDVLWGRGKMCQNHVGNVRLRFWVERHRKEYEACDKQEKTELADKIVKLAQERKGRFIKEDGAGWSGMDRSG